MTARILSFPGPVPGGEENDDDSVADSSDAEDVVLATNSSDDESDDEVAGGLVLRKDAGSRDARTRASGSSTFIRVGNDAFEFTGAAAPLAFDEIEAILQATVASGAQDVDAELRRRISQRVPDLSTSRPVCSE